jgi:hypothetical protein
VNNQIYAYLHHWSFLPPCEFTQWVMFLPLLIAQLEQTSWNHTCSGQQLFLNIRNTLDMRPSQLLFHSQKQEEITSGQIMWARTKEATVMFSTPTNHHCFCSLVSNQCTNFVEKHYMVESSLRICWHVPHKIPNLPAISKTTFHLSSLTNLLASSTFSSM